MWLKTAVYAGFRVALRVDLRSTITITITMVYNVLVLACCRNPPVPFVAYVDNLSPPFTLSYMSK